MRRFGFLITIKPECKLSRNEIVSRLEDNNIQTRPLFAGNLLRHPCFMHLKEGVDYKIASDLSVTDYIMNNTFWVGVYPAMTIEMLTEIVKQIKKAVDR